MSEGEIVKNTQHGPVTVDILMEDVQQLGVKPGQTLLVHSSLSALGWVCGGPVAVILALERVLGAHGTLVMPTHSADLSDPSEWKNPPVPKDWWQTIRETMPAYDPDLTPTRMMGVIAESFRKQPGVARSNHPQFSFAAWGVERERVTSGHTLAYGMGENSPLARVYDLNGWILLLGVRHSNNSSLHVAESRANYPEKRTIRNGAPVLMNGQREWVEFDDFDMDESDFETLGAEFARSTGLARAGKVGEADALLLPQRALIDFGAKWMEENRVQDNCS